jgi:hypothetical protein
MEWMLQVVDEIDDAVGAARLYWLGLGSEIGLALAGSLGIVAIIASIAADAEIQLIWSAAIMFSLAAALKIHESRLQSGS